MRVQPWLSLPFAEHEAGIVPAKAQTVAERVFHLHGAAGVGNVIQVAFRVGLLVVDGGRRKLVAQRQRGEHGFHAACTAQQVAGHALGRNDGDVPGMGTEHRMDGGGLAAVVHVGAGAWALMWSMASGAT